MANNSGSATMAGNKVSRQKFSCIQSNSGDVIPTFAFSSFNKIIGHINYNSNHVIFYMMKKILKTTINTS